MISTNLIFFGLCYFVNFKKKLFCYCYSLLELCCNTGFFFCFCFFLLFFCRMKRHFLHKTEMSFTEHNNVDFASSFLIFFSSLLDTFASVPHAFFIQD